MLVINFFSFSKDVFYPSKNKFQFLITIIKPSACALSFHQSKVLLFSKELMSHVLILFVKGFFPKAQ